LKYFDAKLRFAFLASLRSAIFRKFGNWSSLSFSVSLTVFANRSDKVLFSSKIQYFFVDSKKSGVGIQKLIFEIKN